MAQDGQSSGYKESEKTDVRNETTDGELVELEEEKPTVDEQPQPSAEGASAEELKAMLALAQQEVEQQKEQALRSRAEAQNTLRRAEREVEHAHKYGLEKFVQELLPVVDNLERALGAPVSEDAGVQALREGVELTLDLFLKALARFQVEQIDPSGEPFNPQFHQAMSMVENPELEANTVMAVMQKGYTLHGRLVRPAMVVVAKGQSSSAPKIDEQA